MAIWTQKMGTWGLVRKGAGAEEAAQGQKIQVYKPEWSMARCPWAQDQEMSSKVQAQLQLMLCDTRMHKLRSWQNQKAWSRQVMLLEHIAEQTRPHLAARAPQAPQDKPCWKSSLDVSLWPELLDTMNNRNGELKTLDSRAITCRL